MKNEKGFSYLRQGLVYSVFLALFIMGLGGVGFWILEPHVHSFSQGLWLAFTTAATVGYGDIVPSTPISRLFAAVVVLLGLGVLSLVTASVAELFVQTEERRIEDDLLQVMQNLRQETIELKTQINRMDAKIDKIYICN
jgi:voltage-gated potassium channel